MTRWAPWLGRLEAWIGDHPRLAVGALFALPVAAALRTAWVAEDAFISFRSVEQLLAGNGPRWNPHERVQSFTHPLWFGCLVLGRIALGDPYWASILLGLACASATLLLLFRSVAWRPGRALWFTALLVSGKAWMDYTTSGLENPLSYLLLAGFLLSGARLAERSGRASFSEVLLPLACFALLALNRLDTLSLTAPTAGWLLWRARREIGGGPALGALVLASLPLLLWTAYALVYFGFPLPNTAYAKLNTGIPPSLLLRQSAGYFWNSLRWDPIAIPLALASVGLAWAAGRPFWRSVAAGIVLNLAYVAAVGGDFMSGRFFALAYLAAVIVFVNLAGPRSRRATAVALLALLLLSPSHPLRFRDFEKRSDGFRIADERSYYVPASSLGTCLRRLWRGRGCPDHEWIRDGLAFRDSGRRATVRVAIGMFGYAAGLDQIVIDRLALTDPLLARLPVEGSWRIGHFERALPEGYLETVLSGRNRIRDPDLREWYDHMTVITQGPLFSRERWVTIARMNLGAFRHLLRGHALPGS